MINKQEIQTAKQITGTEMSSLSHVKVKANREKNKNNQLEWK